MRTPGFERLDAAAMAAGSATSVRPKLRVGLLLDDLSAASWAYRMVEIIGQSDYAGIVVAVKAVPDAADGAAREGRLTRLRTRPLSLLQGAVRKVLEALYRRLFERNTSVPGSEVRKNLTELLQGVPVLEVAPVRTRWSDSLTDDDLRKIADFDLDVVIRMGFRILRGGVLKSARYGVWSYHHGDNLLNRGGPPGFWESMEGWPVTGSVLQILSEDLDNGTVLYRSFSCTNGMSVLDSRRNYFWKSLSFLPRMLRQLQRQGPEAFFGAVHSSNVDPVLYSKRLYTQPTNREYARLLAGRIVTKIGLVLRNRFWFDQWILLFDIKQELSSSLWRYKRIVPPPDRFWADPHVVETDDGYCIFIEEYPYADARGHISVIEMDRKGNWKPPVPVLMQPYHLSYPFVFQHEGEYYMIPESAANATIEMYRCVQFPHRWELHEVLMTGVKAYDSTIVQHDGRYWLFANMVENQGASSWDELFVFSADKPVGGQWKAHPANPVVSDCRQARPAGRFMSMGGRLYRPSQNCAPHYGYGFNIARVDRLDGDAYEETVVTCVQPDWASDVVATHTFSRAGALHVIDAQVRRRRGR